MLKFLGRSESKIFQAHKVPPDPIFLTLQSQKILLFFVPPDSCLVPETCV